MVPEDPNQAADPSLSVTQNDLQDPCRAVLAGLRRRPEQEETRFVDAANHSDWTVRSLGLEPGQLQAKWRTSPPPMPAEPRGIRPDESLNDYIADADVEQQRRALADWNAECLAAIVEGLVCEGVTAWPGDGTLCVQQIVAAFAARARDAGLQK